MAGPCERTWAGPLNAVHVSQLHRSGAGASDRRPLAVQVTAGHLDRLVPRSTSVDRLRQRSATFMQPRVQRTRQAVRWALSPGTSRRWHRLRLQPEREQQPPSADEVLALIGRPRTLIRCSGSTFGWWQQPGCAEVKRAGSGGRRRPRRGTARRTAEPPRTAGSVGDHPSKTRSAAPSRWTRDGDVTEDRVACRSPLARFAGVDDDTRRAGYEFSCDTRRRLRLAEHRPAGSMNASPEGRGHTWCSTARSAAWAGS